MSTKPCPGGPLRLLRSLGIVACLVLAGCTATAAAMQPPPTPGALRLTATPIVVDIVIPTPARSAFAPAAPTRTPRATATRPRPRPTATATPAITPTAGVQPAAGQTILLPDVPPDATTGLTVTDQFSDTAVPPPAAPVALPPGTINVALLGVDSRPMRGFANTDVIIIASINPDLPAVTLLSIPRDTLVYIPGWRSHKVNTAFAHGGPDLFKQTIRYNFGLNVDYFVMVNFSAVVNVVDTLGGVDVVATCPLYHVFPKDPYYMADPAMPMTVTVPYTDTFSGQVWPPGIAVPTQTIDIPLPGVYSLNGLQSLAYVRARYGVPGGDVDRGRREQRLIRALFAKAKRIDAIAKVPELYAQFQQYVKTDLTFGNILYFASLAPRFDDAIIRSRFIDGGGLTGAGLPVVGSVLIPNRETMQPYIQQALSVALNQRPNDGVPIEVWNGAGDPNWGIVAADRLSELGFVVTSIQQADKLYPATTIVDFTTTQKGSALPLLQRTFGIRNENVIAQPSQDGPRYRIIAGPDFNPCYYLARAPASAPQPAPTSTPAP